MKKSFLNLLSKVKERPMTQTRGLIMWATLLFSYFLFTFYWSISTGLLVENNQSYISFFFGGDVQDVITIQAGVNYGISLGRAVGSFFVGYLIVKYTHKFASIISLFLMLMAIPSTFINVYGVFIFLRSLFAIGGTMTIILLQPVISGYFKEHIKGKLAILNSSSYNLGVIFGLIPFTLNQDAINWIQRNWSWVLFGISLLNFFPLIIYLFLGQRYDEFDAYKKHQKEINRKKGIYKIQKFNFINFIKKRNVWAISLFYGFWLILVIFPIIFRDSFHRLANAQNISNISTQDSVQILAIWCICCLSGVFIGKLTVGLWPQLKARRKPFIIFTLIIVILLLISCIFSYLFMVEANSEITFQSTFLFYFLGFFFGAIGWGLQAAILHLPHEIKNTTSNEVAYKFSLIWGFGYLTYSIFNIILSYINDADIVWFFVALIIVSCFAPITALLIQETKKEYPILPKRKDLWIAKNHKISVDEV